MITAIDGQIGRVVQTLDKRGLRQNTLIIFHSDYGGNQSAHLAGETEVKGPLPASNGPYRGGKGDLYEGGTRVPSLINWPGRIKPGTVVDQMIHVVDYYPTLAKLAGASLSKSKPLDGLDMWPTISDGKSSPRAKRSLRPLPCSMRSSMRSESMSDTFSATTSETRNPAP